MKNVFYLILVALIIAVGGKLNWPNRLSCFRSAKVKSPYKTGFSLCGLKPGAKLSSYQANKSIQVERISALSLDSTWVAETSNGASVIMEAFPDSKGTVVALHTSDRKATVEENGQIVFGIGATKDKVMERFSLDKQNSDSDALSLGQGLELKIGWMEERVFSLKLRRIGP